MASGLAKEFTPEPFTLNAGEIISKTCVLGVSAPKENQVELGPKNAIVDYYLLFNVVDSKGIFRSQRELVASKVVEENQFEFSKFPQVVKLLPSPPAKPLPFPRNS